MILVIIIASLLIRLVSLNQSLWLDEGISVLFAKSLSYKSLMFNFSLSDFHPPLFYVLLKFWISIFGSSEISVRLPSLLFGLASIVIIFLIAKKLFDLKTALIAATLLGTSPLHIYYSQEARMYMPALFLASASVLFFLLIIEKDKFLYWLGFIISTVLLLYTDYMPYLLIPAYLLYLIKFKNKILTSVIKSFIPAFIIILTLCLPLLFILPKQLQGGLKVASLSPIWAKIAGNFTLKDFFLTFAKFTIGRISIDNNVVYLIVLLPVASFITLLLAISLLRISTKRSFLWFWFVLPIIFAFGISFFVPIFSYFRLLFVLPAFYILLASGITNLNWTKPIRILLSVMLIINIISTILYLSRPKFHREDWRSAASYVKESASSNTIVLFESPSSIAPFDYYNSGSVQAEGVLDSFNPNREIVLEKTKLYTQNKNKVFLFQYLLPITDPQGLAFQSLIDLGFQNTKTKDFNGVGFIYEFVK